MERNHLRRLRESGIPLDTTGPMRSFAIGIAPDHGEPLQLIPRERWPEEMAAMAAEEADFWKSRSISVRLIVELPFWLMIPDSDIRVAHQEAIVVASVCGNYAEVSAGNTFFDSHGSVVHIGPAAELKCGKTPASVVGVEMPIYRHMKTVVIFRPAATEDAVLELRERGSVTQQELRKLRRLNRAHQYLESLAYAHIPFLNSLITSYRLTSADPFAFQVSEWDVPVWFVEYDGTLMRICLMPYSNADSYPTLRGIGQDDPSPFYAASPDAVRAQADEDVAPGTLEILDARSLLYRGRLDDAVRSAVTAIEVALEAQITKLLTSKGCTAPQIEQRLAKTWNDFDKRVADYERLAGVRVPGPILSRIPYINGIRLKSELGRVRRLRHKIVHEGLRADCHSRGPMLRAIETMTWLFYWLSWEEGKAQDKSRTYTLCEAVRGRHIPRYHIKYDGSGVVVLPDDRDDEQAKTADELIRAQYARTIDGKDSDIELFTLMSFAYLGIDAEDALPPPDGAVVYERYYINHKERRAIVFCLECDGVIGCSTIEAVGARLREYEQHHEGICSALCVINHQKSRPISQREVEEAIPEKVNRLAGRFGITLITAPDLQFLVEGAAQYEWDIDRIKDLMFVPGRQGKVPPAYRQIGACVHFYGRVSVMSVGLQPGEMVETGRTLGIRLATRYHEEPIESLQVERKTVSAATGPCRVGIKTTLKRSDVDVGQAIFLRRA